MRWKWAVVVSLLFGVGYYSMVFHILKKPIENKTSGLVGVWEMRGHPDRRMEFMPNGEVWVKDRAYYRVNAGKVTLTGPTGKTKTTRFDLSHDGSQLLLGGVDTEVSAYLRVR